MAFMIYKIVSYYKIKYKLFFQLNDCYHGVIFDSLETLFSPNQQATALSLLKAINNRRHIYFINQKLDFATVKAKQRAKEDDEGKCKVLFS